jgi:hypothetical protein
MSLRWVERVSPLPKEQSATKRSGHSRFRRSRIKICRFCQYAVFPLNYYNAYLRHELTFKKPATPAARSDSDLSVDLMVDSREICKFPVWWSDFGDAHVNCFYHLAFLDRIGDSNSPLPYSHMSLLFIEDFVSEFLSAREMSL